MDMRGFRPLAIQFDSKGFFLHAQKCLSERKHLAMKNVHDGEVVHPSIDAQQIYVQARKNSIVLADPTTSSSSRT
jgi:hypothetical protein